MVRNGLQNVSSGETAERASPAYLSRGGEESVALKVDIENDFISLRGRRERNSHGTRGNLIAVTFLVLPFITGMFTTLFEPPSRNPAANDEDGSEVIIDDPNAEKSVVLEQDSIVRDDYPNVHQPSSTTVSPVKLHDMDIVGNTETQKTKSGGNKFEDMNKTVQSEKDLTED